MSIADLSGHYTIDPTHSAVGFVARHAMITKVRGAFTHFSGEFTVNQAALEQSSAAVTVQVASIDTRNGQRDEHLRAGDFFDAENFPEMSFRSTAVSVSGDEVEVTGDLTIKDVTKSVTLPLEFTGSAVDPYGNTRVGFEGSTTINRQDFGLTFNAALETGGVLISDKIALEFEISAIADA